MDGVWELKSFVGIELDSELGNFRIEHKRPMYPIFLLPCRLRHRSLPLVYFRLCHSTWKQEERQERVSSASRLPEQQVLFS